MTPAQRAYEVFIGHAINWETVTPLSRELWERVAAAALRDEDTHG